MTSYRRFLNSALLACSLVTAAPVTAQDKTEASAWPRQTVTANQTEDNRYKLPRQVSPQSYQLTFHPDFEKFTFSGTARISVNVAEPVDSVLLNALDLKITSAKTKGGHGDLTGTVEMDAEHETARLTFPEKLTQGKHELDLAFTGTLNDNLRGFYRSYYKDENGNKHWLATTQMEPTDARRMFPCFDEPEMKATFQVTAVIPQDMSAISNGAVQSQSTDAAKKLKTVIFSPSPKMSSYLVALIIGNFKSSPTKQCCGIPVQVWAPAGKEGLTAYALDTACRVLTYQTKYFGIPYPGKKLDLVAIPDFRSGAMENLGCITFREASLLVDSKTGSIFLKQRVAGIVAHEIAHQWFGDLVTMKWWDDIWLNEAFASWMATKTVNVMEPQWQEWTKAVHIRNEAMDVDQLKATRAIHAHVENPKQAAEMFDPITYDKGEAVLRMLETFVSPEKFQAGVHDYLSAHLFGNAESEDLWQAIGKKANGVPVPEIMKSWVMQAGFPIVSATSEGDSRKLTLTQDRFFSMPGEKSGNAFWMIPAVLRDLNVPASQSKPFILGKQTDSIQLPDSWRTVILNGGGMGFYRSHYGKGDTNAIIQHFDALTKEERLSFISDISAQVVNATLPVDDRLNLLLKIASENDPLVLADLINLSDEPYYYVSKEKQSRYAELLCKWLTPIKSKYGWNEKPGEQATVKNLRDVTLLQLGTIAQDKNTIKEASKLYESFLQNRQSVPADITGTILSIVAFNGGEKEYDAMVAAWKKEKIPELEKKFLYKLAWFRQPALIERTLALTLSADVRAQDGFRILADLLALHDSRHHAWQFVKAHWSEITNKFPPRSLSAIASACKSFDDEKDEHDITTFFTANALAYGKAAVARMLEDLHTHVLYRQRNQAAISDWVDHQ